MTRLLSEAQWRAIDKLVGEYLREEPTLLNMIPTVRIKEWTNIADYAAPTSMDVIRHGQNFHYEQANTASRKWNANPIDYVTAPVYISEKDLNASTNDGMMGIIAQAEMEAMSYMVEEMEKTIMHGSDRAGNEGATNFSTDTAEANIASNAAAAVWTTAGNFQADLETAIAELRENHVKPPYSFIGTPGIASELRGNTLANIGNEWAEVKDIYLENDKIIKSFEFSDRIYDGTLAADTQQFLLFKAGIQYGYVAESLPLHRVDLPQLKEFPGDIAYAIRRAITFIPKNANAWALCTGGTTTNAY